MTDRVAPLPLTIGDYQIIDENSPEAHIDVATLLETRLLVQGSSGAGKSWALFWLLQATFGRVQQIIIDREGEFARLRKEYPYLLAGADGDVPARLDSATLTVRRALELHTSLIVDLSEFRPDQQQEYVRRVASELAHLPRSSGLWTPCIVVVDELQVFAPQTGKAPASLEALIDLASLGRKRGFCLVGATLRLARVNKDVAALLENKLIGRTGFVDLARAGEELDFTKKGARELKNLERGQFYAYGPAISNDPVLVRTPSKLRVEPPKRGEVKQAPPPAPKEIAALLEQLRDLPEQAAEEARTLGDAKARIAALERQLAQVKRGGVERIVDRPVADERAIAAAVKASRRELRQTIEPQIRGIRTALGGRLAVVRELAEIFDSSIARADLALEAFALEPATAPTNGHRESGLGSREPRAESREPRARVFPAPRAAAPPAEGVTASDMKVLNALALMERIDSPGERVNVAFFSGYSLGGRFNNIVGSLNTRGLIHYPRDGSIALTDEGRAVASADEASVSTLDKLQALWLAKLPPSESKVLRALIDAYPDSLTREELAKRTDYTVGGRFNNIVGRLATLGAASYPAKGLVVAGEPLFPAGLR